MSDQDNRYWQQRDVTDTLIALRLRRRLHLLRLRKSFAAQSYSMVETKRKTAAQHLADLRDWDARVGR